MHPGSELNGPVRADRYERTLEKTLPYCDFDTQVGQTGQTMRLYYVNAVRYGILSILRTAHENLRSK